MNQVWKHRGVGPERAVPIQGPRNLPAAVFQVVLRAAAERVDMESPGFVDAMREEAALLGWVQMDEKDPKSWIRLVGWP